MDSLKKQIKGSGEFHTTTDTDGNAVVGRELPLTRHVFIKETDSCQVSEAQAYVVHSPPANEPRGVVTYRPCSRLQ
jgi:hypothetical protein